MKGNVFVLMYSQMLISVQSGADECGCASPAERSFELVPQFRRLIAKSQSPCLSRGEKYRSLARVLSSSARTPRG